MKRSPCPDLREQREAISAYVLPRIKEMPNGCWEWQKWRNALGYGMGTFKGRIWTVTRLMYCATVGAFDPQMDVCHTCDNPSCVNPTHLWIGTRQQNSRDCIEKKRHYKQANTHCPRGHSFAEHGYYPKTRPNWRVCRICELARHRIRLGWPEDLAYSVPKQRLCRKVGIGHAAPKVGGSRKKTHCKRGHPLEGENIYKKPGGGRQCKICHDAAAAAWIKRGKIPLNATR